MKCHQAMKTIIGDPCGSSPAVLAALAHARSCPNCAELLQLEALLTADLQTQSDVTVPDIEVLRRSISGSRLSWIQKVMESRKMKRITTATALIAAVSLVTVAFVGRTANGAEPKSLFRSMKKAVLATSKSKKVDDGKEIELRVEGGKDGKAEIVLVVDGVASKLAPGQSIELKQGDAHFEVHDGNFSNMDPEAKAKIQKLIDQGLADGSITSSGGTVTIVNGKKVDPSKVNDILKKAGINIKITVDLDENHYKSIAYGKNQDVLVLTPNKDATKRYVVSVDPKSKLPKNIALEQFKNGKWAAARS